MGKIVSKIFSLGIREIKVYNIEKRAEKVISKEKPEPAPKYSSTLLELERLKEENVSKEYLYKKDSQLDENLKNVYVTSTKPESKEVEPNPNRQLPRSRFINYSGTQFGYSDTEEAVIPEGRLSLKQAVQLIADHRSDPLKHSNTALATQYKLPITLTDDILEYFKMFDVRYESEKHAPASQSAYEKLVKRAEEMTIKNASEIIHQFPQFKTRKFFIDKEVKGVRTNNESSNDNVDSNISDIKKEEKQKT